MATSGLCTVKHDFNNRAMKSGACIANCPAHLHRTTPPPHRYLCDFGYGSGSSGEPWAQEARECVLPARCSRPVRIHANKLRHVGIDVATAKRASRYKTREDVMNMASNRSTRSSHRLRNLRQSDLRAAQPMRWWSRLSCNTVGAQTGGRKEHIADN